MTWQGVDAVTGLPVLMYDMPYPPLREAERLESEHVPGVLATSFDGRRGELIAAFSTEYHAIRPADVNAKSVLAAARALQDAARVGIVHGDLRPDRILMASGHLLVEGYGVPWSPSDAGVAAPESTRTPAADVYALCATFLELGRERLGDDAIAVLEQGVASDADARPPAASLVRKLERIVGSNAPATSPSPAVLPEQVPEDAPTQGSNRRVPDAEPLVIDTDPGEDMLETSSKRPTTGGFSKQPPPGTRYRSGEPSSPTPPGSFKFPSLHDGQILGTGPRRWYRFAVLGATLVLAAILAFLALSRQGDRFNDPTATRAVVYVIDVAVSPANLPPVTLFVTEGPRGSKWQPGTALGNVPGRIVLDREGVWQLQGRFQDRVSEIAMLDLPSERQVTLTFTPRETTP